jgi:hypothetical protein
VASAYGTGGGGGALQLAGNGDQPVAVTVVHGTASTISGTSVTYAGGGGGGLSKRYRRHRVALVVEVEVITSGANWYKTELLILAVVVVVTAGIGGTSRTGGSGIVIIRW